MSQGQESEEKEHTGGSILGWQDEDRRRRREIDVVVRGLVRATPTLLQLACVLVP